MKTISKILNVEVPLTPEEVAKIFCDMSCDEQAIFFNSIATESKKWVAPFVIQLQWITDSHELNDEGRNVMREIGNYSKQ